MGFRMAKDCKKKKRIAKKELQNGWSVEKKTKALLLKKREIKVRRFLSKRQVELRKALCLFF